MEKKEKIKVIVDILLKHERTLSDGYEYYSGALDGRKGVTERVEKYLSKIAKEILSKI